MAVALLTPLLPSCHRLMSQSCSAGRGDLSRLASSIMPPLTRQQTPQSIRSWWSDSNSVGATVSIHAAAKPLMKIMYHSQARSFIKRYRDAPLSKEVLDIYLSYLMFKYVSPATKAMVFSELRIRTRSDEGAPAVVELLGSDRGLIMELLHSFDVEIRRWACTIIAGVAGFRREAGDIVTMEPCTRLVALLSDTAVCDEAIHALAKISGTADGAQTVVNADALLHVQDLLKSTNAQVRRWSCQLLGNLARHDSTVAAVLEISPCVQLVSLSKQDIGVHSCAIYALAMISNRPDGALAVMNASVVGLVQQLLPSGSDRRTLGWTCVLLECLAEHQPGAFAVLSQMRPWHIIYLLSDDDVDFRRHGLCEVTRIIKAGGAQEIIEAQVLHYVGALLNCGDKEIQEQTCAMLGDLASHLPTIHRSMFDGEVFQQLMSLSSETNHTICRGVVRALWIMCEHPMGAAAIASLNVHHRLSRLLDSADTETAGWTCKILGRLACSQGSLLATLGIMPCRKLVSLLSDNDLGVRRSAIHVLSTMCAQSKGAWTVLSTNVFDHVLELLHSPDPRDVQLTLRLVRHLVDHESTATEALKAIPYQQVVLSSASDDIAVYSSAASALCAISQWPDGAKAILNAGALDHVPKLLDSADVDTKEWTCSMVGNFARHKLLLLVGLLIRRILTCLGSLLSDGDLHIRRCSIYALYHISLCAGGERVVVDAKLLGYVLQLLDLDDHDTQKYTALLVGRLAEQEDSTALEVLTVDTCLRLVLLSDNISVHQSAAYALSTISQGLCGAKATLKAGALAYASKPLDSTDAYTCGRTCELLANLARHALLPLARSALEFPRQLVLHLSDGDMYVRRFSIYALYHISLCAGGERVVVDAKVLDYMLQLLDSDDHDTQKYTVLLVGRLVEQDESMALEVLEIDPCPRLVLLSTSDDIRVNRRAACALRAISRWLDGAKAVLRAHKGDYISNLLDSADADVRGLASDIVASLAWHKLLRLAGSALEFPRRLVSLLSDGDKRLRECSIAALYQISFCAGGNRAVLDAEILDYVPQLLDTNDLDTQKWTCLLLGNLASRTHPTSSP
ncbi:armadillo-type protein [Mycena polygramma]|nr:armadillo-type protein [Mycena polygramma]